MIAYIFCFCLKKQYPNITANIGTVYARLMTKPVFDELAIIYTNEKYPNTGPIQVDIVMRDICLNENNCTSLLG